MIQLYFASLKIVSENGCVPTGMRKRNMIPFKNLLPKNKKICTLHAEPEGCVINNAALFSPYAFTK